MKQWIFLFLIFTLNNSLSAKEWRNLIDYQKSTRKDTLSSSDWLKPDRIKNTIVWQQANTFNLKNNLPNQYSNIVQRRDFYKWLFIELVKNNHDVVWIKMAHYISKKMHVMEVFPYSIFTKNDTKFYAEEGSKVVFHNAFAELIKIYNSDFIFKADDALEWDKEILIKEQYQWIDGIYKTMDAKSLRTLERIAKRKFLYGLVVPKAIKFEGDLNNPEARFKYAVQVLRSYCKKGYQ